MTIISFDEKYLSVFGRHASYSGHVTTSTPDPATAASASELGWLLRQVRLGYEADATAVVGDQPGGLRGFQLLCTALEGCPRSQIELGRKLGIDRNAMVHLVDELEAAGWVERRPDPNDRRNKSVSVTEKGTKAHHDLQARIAEATASLFEPLSPAERVELASLLDRVARGRRAEA
jgi:DNA-binding MarR family transcriptional regulator